MGKIDYSAIFQEKLEPLLSVGGSTSKEELFSDERFGLVSSQTKLSHLRRFLKDQPSFVGTVQGILPPIDSIIDIVEGEIGSKISENNVVQANKRCASIVKNAFAPLLQNFVQTSLNTYLEGENLNIPLVDLVDFLSDEFAPFLKSAGNGLVSVAGGINEKLLARCLASAGLVENTDFSVTGTESEGDIVVHSHSGAKVNLGVEIKSYHARERLLRGLRDINRPKVGAGYFINPAEFNPNRTKLLLQTQTAAIYMPHETLEKLPMASREMESQDTISYGSQFYRPLERFASDMAEFSKIGKLPTT